MTVDLKNRQETMPARDAATVVLLRDGAEGLEVFMVKRHGLSDVLGGAYVFPGGKVDRSDADQELLKQIGAPFHALQAALAEPEVNAVTAAGFFMAACRETFEEAGILLAEGATTAHLEAIKAHTLGGVGSPRFSRNLACSQIGATSSRGLVGSRHWCRP